MLSYLYLKSGNPLEALKECDKGLNSAAETDNLAMQRFALFFKGLVHLEMKSVNLAQNAVEELKELIDIGLNRKAIRYYYGLVGQIELEKENLSLAIENFKQALSLLPYQTVQTMEFYLEHTALFDDFIALAYFLSGDLPRAQEKYEKIISLSTGRYYFGDIYAKSFYMLGKIYEQQGNTARAIENYEKFLSLWKEADPGIVEVEDAKERLAALLIN